jgi:phosphoribosylaminoimidazolecarboxamide formyltransferase/IMP cyclohydrolase
MRKITTAVLSVSDKTGIVDLARCLNRHGVRLISTGGTRMALEGAGIPVMDITAFTGNPEAFGGRMKTLSFTFESAILFDRERDADEAASLGIDPIDLVVCNLYPFRKVRDAGAGFAELIENIDIGGPTMLRAAAKNFRGVAAVCDPVDYKDLMRELDTNDGALCLDTRQRLMRKVYAHTAEYDRVIASTLDELAGEPAARLAFSHPQPLRYGENPHQDAVFFSVDQDRPTVPQMDVLGGKAISFNNIVDLAAAAEAVCELPKHGCAVIKHTNPCGLAVADTSGRALELAWEGDPVSAFGSIIAFNTPIGKADVELLALDSPDKNARRFVEVILAPDFTEDAIEYLKLHEALRVVRLDPAAFKPEWDYRFVAGGLLRQRPDRHLFDKLEVVTEHAPAQLDEALLTFGIMAVRSLKSNTICIVRRMDDGSMQLLGMGAGQPNRVTSSRLALEKARENVARETGLEGEAFDRAFKAVLSTSIVISDAFFPFPDNVELLAAGGARTLVQPGGSIRDKRVIKTCNELGVAMVFTGTRHFKH